MDGLESPQLRTPPVGDVESNKRWSVLSQIGNLVNIAGVNVSYSVPVKPGKLASNDATATTATTKNDTKLKPILNNITAEFVSGRMTAVMGASGAGKTSLLYAMAGELPPQSLHGTLLVNGEEWSPRRVREISGFVFQDDVLLDTMTVREALWMSATLRVRGITVAERVKMVDELLEILGLRHCQNTIVGSPAQKGISGGERKRCSIAMELITNPAVLFLDEPTSGLDTLTAYNVVRTLRELAHEHARTVICTIHQPSSDIYHLFDDLLLLGEGRVLYHGPVADAVAYFAALHFACPQYTNPADYFFMHVRGGQHLYAAWSASPQHRAIMERIAGQKPVGVAKTVVRRRANRFTQFVYLLKRTMRNAWRNKMILHVKLLQNVLVGLLVGLIYYDTDSKAVPVQIQDRNGALYFVVVSQFMGASMGFVSVFSQEKAVFLREYGAGYYSIVPYFFSKILVEVPVQVLCPVVFVAICYYMIGLQPAIANFFRACMVAVATALSGMAVGTVAGAAFPDITMALVVLPLILLPLMMFSGLFVNVGSLPVYFAWIKWISPMKYAYAALMKNEYEGLQFANCDPRREACSGELVLEQMSMQGGLSIGENIATLFGIYLILMIIGFLALAMMSRRRRIM